MRCLPVFAALALMALGTHFAHAESTDLEKKVAAIFDARCAECHGTKLKKEAGKTKSGNQEMLLDSHSTLNQLAAAKALFAGKSMDSEIVRRICMPANDDDRMPPKGDLLKAEEIALIKQWIDS